MKKRKVAKVSSSSSLSQLPKRKPIPASISPLPRGAPIPRGANRPAIPAEIKREVRKRCGFGCVICGCPLYDYEHMEEWAIVKRHVADEITLLCPTHHREKTNGLLPKSEVLKRNSSPINLIRGISKPHTLHLYGADISLGIGGTHYFYDKSGGDVGAIVLSISNRPMLGFRMEDGNLLLQLVIYDDDRRPIIHIFDNELVFATQLWDITFVGSRLQIRSARGKLWLSLFVNANEGVVLVERADLRFDGYEVRIDEDGLSLPGSFNALTQCRLFGSGWIMNVGGIPLPQGSGAALNFTGRRTYGPMKE